ncbi:PREDICTED: leucine-rich PPR motif-containing protein, mitochondrial [Papilio xuthus]|uniref:Leucine-rich PPR motif-containing protein, mitochondrial n=1 Tax=Papilio xuthus TaxID=66420 RepID=A0AAJ6ZV12_PAPXU|nr:PREDICTED: leucine-rich PPR motif-containing protein, mitochondrial [Papilio xuthus]
MSSLLRSTKFIRYFTGAARTLILNSAKSAEANLLINSKSLSASNSVLLRDYTTSKKKENLEPLLQRLDSDVRRFGRITKKDIDEVFDEIISKSDITSSQSLLVIRCCGELVPEELPEQRTLLVQKIWSVLTERGIPMDISHYNALLRVYIENEHPFSPAKILEELENKGLQPNRVTYQRLMWRYCQEGDVDGATKVLEKMRELNLPVSEPVLNALVMGHAFHGDTDGAKAVLETMAAAGLQPTNRTYTLLACGFARKGDIQSIKDIINTATAKDTFLCDKDILDIIENLAIGGHNDKIDELFPHLQKSQGYNQDVCNLVLRLLNKGHEDSAKKMIKTMAKVLTSDETPFKCAFFVKHLVKLNNSPDNVVKSCRALQEEGLAPKALYIAAETAFHLKKPELAQKLLKELQKDGFELRQHYFWPILAQKGNEGDEEGLLQVLRDMAKEGLIPTGEALRDYVIPFLIGKDTPENIILKLQIANVPLALSARNVMVEVLETADIKKAADIALQYRPKGQYTLISRPLIHALNITKDIKSFVTILHVISRPQQTNIEDDSMIDETQKDDVISREIGRIVKIAVKNLVNPELCEQLLQELHSKGLTISTSYAEEIEQYLGQNMTTNLSELLTKLTSPDLEVVPLESPRRTGPLNSAQLEQLLTRIKSKGGNNIIRIQKQLLDAYIKENKVEKVNSFLEELKSTNFEITIPTLAQLFEFYSVNDNVDKAREIKDQITEKDPGFKLNKYKIVHFANALVKANKYEEALQFLEDNKQMDEDELSGFMLNSKCWQMLNNLAEQKDVTKVKELTKSLIENKYIEPSNVILGPSIKVHIIQNDMEGALNEFEKCCKQYRSTPWKGELMKSLILAEDATKLQWLADLGTQIHGEVNILHDLVLAFVECGRLRQARRILETPGMHTRQKRLDDACQRYVQEGKSEYLEGLLEATKELSYIDRSNIFYHLLVTYCKANETDKALGLWTILQEEGEIPSEQFLIYLGNHLKSQQRDVPFIIPRNQTNEIPVEKKIVKKTTPQETKSKESKQSTPQLTKKEVSTKVEELVKEGNASAAMDYTIKCIQNGVIPLDNVTKFMLKSLSEEGNVEKIQSLGGYLTKSKKQHVTYDDKLTLAIFKKGNGSQHIDSLCNALQVANTEEQIEEIIQKFPRTNAYALAVQNEEMSQKCQRLVLLAASKGHFFPANLLWMEYLLVGNDKDADLIWNQALSSANVIVFRRLLQQCYVRNDIKPIEKVISSLKTNKNLPSATLANAYSRLIDILVLNNKMNEAKSAYEDALSCGITQDEINKNTLQRLNISSENSSAESKSL